jgi:hypothetical protein
MIGLGEVFLESMHPMEMEMGGARPYEEMGKVGGQRVCCERLGVGLGHQARVPSRCTCGGQFVKHEHAVQSTD